MFLYNLGIHLFNIALRIASLFNPKAKQWIKGRKNWKPKLIEQVAALNLENAVWLHAASLGEFEQGKPVIEEIKKQFPHQKLILTFFSPSGYEIQKHYPLADLVLYLPIDTAPNAQKFLNIIKPKVAIFVKYEFWLNYLAELKQQQIPTFLISTVIKRHQPFFKWYGWNFRKAIHTYHTIYTQDVYSLRLLKLLGYHKGVLAGDTRFDRVLQICSAPKQLTEIEHFANNSFVIVAGSSWAKDEDILIETYTRLKNKHSSLKLIIAPHEIEKKNIDRLCNLLHKHHLPFHLFSKNEPQMKDAILIINAIGFLSSIYQYGTIALIGGGFNNGIHNILEPTVYGLPVLFGPNYHKFNEAHQILDLKAGFVFQNADELEKQIQAFLSNSEYLSEASALAKNYVQKNSGATQKIMEGIRVYF